ncbi:MAG: tetratricopeptide repeat protein, partial [Alphaproteobacteria bacterium]|nr:tetratricopeptide repeat protein [Alphaproteobacteria bacterium]
MTSVFLSTPFGDDVSEREQWELHYLMVAQACADAGVECVRVDKVNTAGTQIVDLIEQGIRAADVVVADLSAPSANVAYEIGLGRGLGKPVILLVQEACTDAIPFDLRGFPYTKYASRLHIALAVVKPLRAALEAVAASRAEPEPDDVAPEPRAGRWGTPIVNEEVRLNRAVEAAATDGELTRALSDRAHFHFRLHRFADALADLRRLQELELLDGTTAAMLTEAMNRQRYYDDSIATYATLRHDAGLETAQLHANGAYAMNGAGDYDGAIEAAERALLLDPNHIGARKTIEFARNRKQEARAHTGTARLVDLPQEPSDFVDYVRNLIASRWHDRALEVCDAWLEEAPDDVAVLVEKGRALGYLHRRHEAIETFRRASELEPGDADIHYQLGLVLMDAGDQPTAIVEFRRALRLAGDDDARFLSNLGFRLSRCRDNLSAVEAYTRALELDPLDVQTWMNRGFAFNLMRRNREALKDYDEAVALEPRSTKALAERARTLF